MPSEVWYKEGLKFKCTQCGQCCTGAPGFVWVDKEDVKKLAHALEISEEAFLKTYCRKVGARISLLEKAANYDCIFLKNQKCSLYEARPKQCKKFPWWKDTIKSKAAWQEAKLSCEGIDHEEGKLFTQEEIEALL